MFACEMSITNASSMFVKLSGCYYAFDWMAYAHGVSFIGQKEK
jgi:hypothetical protein